MKSSLPVFLTAEWRHLAMLNYEIDPKILAPFVPAGTELDFWNNKTFVSVIGFLFQKTRVCGITFPFHCDFEEVNLRFYVRLKSEDGWRRAVVFIKEIVPRFAIAFTARTIYNEPYIALPMSHQIDPATFAATYFWRFDGEENFLKIIPRGEPQLPIEGSQQEFITEHYWGYTGQRDVSTLEYRVEHQRWNVRDTQIAELCCDVERLYGEQFTETLSQQPSSAFLAEGSAVAVHKGVKVETC
jgi:hypothetical protein